MIRRVETQVRVWIASSEGRAAELALALRGFGFAVEGSPADHLSLNETDAARWCDVALLPTRSESLDPQLSFLAGLAIGAGRPLVFIGPVPVRFPALAGPAHTLIEPLPADAIAFQMRALGAKTADRRARREKLPAHKQQAALHRQVADTVDPAIEKLAQARRVESSAFESSVLRALARDTGVSSLGGDTWATPHSPSTHDSVIDALAWVDGAAPFNPVPIEIKPRASAAALDRAFSTLVASDATIGALIVGDDTAGQPRLEERDGRFLLTISAHSLSEGSVFSRWIRAIRNEIAHGRRVRGEV